MNILFDARVLDYEFTGVAKTLLYLYKACKCEDSCFKAYGFGCVKHSRNDFSDYGIELIETKVISDNLISKYKIEAIHYPFNTCTKKMVRGLPIILTIHDLIPYEENDFRDYPERFKYLIKMWRSILKADCIITISEYSKESILKFCHGIKRPVVIPWGVTLPLLTNNTDRPKYTDSSYFLYVGGYDKRKGIDILIESYLDIRK